MVLAGLSMFVMPDTAVAAEHEFRHKAPQAQKVELMCDFNGWKAVPMTRNADGVWTTKVTLQPGPHAYKFLVNGSQWVFDADNPKRRTVDGIENSAVEIADSAMAVTTTPSAAPSAPAQTPRPAVTASTPSLSPGIPPAAASAPRVAFSPVPGEVTIFQAPLSATQQAEAARGGHHGDGGNRQLRTAKVAIAVPPGFDSSKPWPIILICNTQAYSNIDAMNQFKTAALAENWIIMAADDAESEPTKEGATREPTAEAAFDYLAQLWPGVKRWPVATGGMSGGGKNCAFLAARLAKNGQPVIGMLMMGVNQDMATTAMNQDRPPAFRQTAVFLSSGTQDTIATPAHHEHVKGSLRGSGFRKLRLESFDGGHVVHEPHVSEALRWFIAQSSATTAPQATATPSSSFDKFFKKTP